jgi:hypothetical protein
VKKVAQKVFNTIFRKFPHLQQVWFKIAWSKLLFFKFFYHSQTVFISCWPILSKRRQFQQSFNQNIKATSQLPTCYVVIVLIVPWNSSHPLPLWGGSLLHSLCHGTWGGEAVHLKGTLARDFGSVFYHKKNAPGPLISTLVYFWI